MCAMEMVAWLAGEEHSDEPRCACPVLTAFVRACNDAMDDAQRNRYLRPLVPRLVHTRASVGVERRRALVAVDALVREHLPSWLAQQGRHDDAAGLAALASVQDRESLQQARVAVAANWRAGTNGPLRAAVWVLDRALDGLAPARYVTGVVHAVRAAGPALSLGSCAVLARRMLEVQEARATAVAVS